MKRDWDLIRRILLTAEAAEPGAGLNSGAFPDEDQGRLFEHVKLLNEAGYLDAAVVPLVTAGPVPGHFMIRGIPWAGHDLLSKIKSETIWNKVKTGAAERGVDLSFDVIKALAGTLIAKLIEG